ncbi:putative holin-like toxin [Paenibacillus sp. FSL R10-2736]|uniref:putative holin-like toxin n=1 Tax=Paenibacillus sp. FSL R10-2736 TaxID=2954692 RepID=UPI004046BDD6
MMNALGVILQDLSSPISSGANMAKVLRRKNKFPWRVLGCIEKSPKAGVRSLRLSFFGGFGSYIKFIHSWSLMFMFGMFIIALLNYLKKK